MSMSKDTEFMGLVLTDDALKTPEGDLRLSEMTRAEFVRDAVKDGDKPTTAETSAPAVAGGAVVGGALFGAVGAVGGGLLGSTVKDEVPGGPSIRTLSVKVVFETAETSFSMDIPREEEVNAIQFVKKVEGAVRRHS
jgi:hypothetical protein